MRDHIARRPMPIEQSIQWKPLRDPHYVVASLQPADGGRRKIFIRQEVIARVEALVRPHGRRTVGLLLGQFYQCPVTGFDYLVIESISESSTVTDENDIATKIAEDLERHAKDHHVHLFGSDRGAHVVGWYRGAPTIEAKPSLTTMGIHASLFSQPWQMALVVAEGSKPDGAFFLRDSVNSRWFNAPFFELLSDPPTANQPKPSVIAWAQYLTTDAIVAAERDIRPRPELVGEPTPGNTSPPRKRYERPWLRQSPTKQNGLQRGPTQDGEVPLADAPRTSPTPTSQADVGEPTLADRPTVDVRPLDVRPLERRAVDLPPVNRPPADRVTSDRPAPQPLQRGFADLPRGPRERSGWRRNGRSADKSSIVDDSDQRTPAIPSVRRVTDDDDTMMGDHPGRYIEIARAEGFFIAAKFEAAGGLGDAETLWILNEPYSGMLLAVVGTGSEVVDATLHYNLQTDDAGLKAAPFPEHRDPESKTIYVRETCMDSLRARCRRLRATNALLREWKVTPAISFLTPGEWDSIPVSPGDPSRGADAISDLSRKRIAELPPGVRSQFRLPDAGEANA